MAVEPQLLTDKQKKSPKAIKHVAPGQYLGFSLQPIRLCFHLLTCRSDSEVSLEHLDDIAIHNADGTTILEQTKSALRQNPISNSAEDLWKTIANWLDLISTGVIDPDKTEFHIYVTPPRAGSWAQALNDAQNLEDLNKFEDRIRKTLERAKKPPGCLELINKFLEAPEAIKLALISHLRVISIHTDPIQPLRDVLSPTIQPELVETICEFAIGMAKERADALIRKGETGKLLAENFQRDFRSLIKANNISNLVSFTPVPKEEQIKELLAARPKFIQQLELIEAKPDQFLRAVGDYLRSSADKTKWAEAGMVFQKHLDDWDDNLLRQYNFISSELSEVYGSDDLIKLGRLLYLKCSQVQAPLEGQAVPLHFVHGSYNALADIPKLGWHPNYESLLKEENMD